MSIKKSKKTVRCADCGETEDLSYICWEDRPLCAPCFAKAVSEYAGSFPFLLANELSLDVIQVPEEVNIYDD